MAYIEPSGRIHKKKSRWTISFVSVVLSSIIALSAIAVTAYFAWQNQNTQNELYNLEYSIHNYSPVIFSTLPDDDWAWLDTLYYRVNETNAIFYGNATVNLIVITPYDSNLTIDISALNFTGRNLPYLDMNNLNFSEHHVSYLYIETPQYFIPHDVTYSINEAFPVEITVDLETNIFPSTATALGFPLGDLIFTATLAVIRQNQTTANQLTIQNFTQHIHVTLKPTS